ncbi:MAG: glycosyltransferase [Candidatus Chisholmbacteria bacterium]|nr:glycosyltransferase [Candidatus Chisholmbacteria bacterium]
MKPTVSVLMSVLNQAEYLASSLHSILTQTFTSFEFIIVNDASNPKTLKCLKQYPDNRIKIIHNPKRLGLARSLNRGLKFCRGIYIARMDADDIALPHRLKVQVDYLTKHPHIAGCGSAAAIIDRQGKKLGIKKFPAPTTKLKSVIMRYSPFIHPTMMLRKKVFDAMGGYNATFNGAEDYDLWLRTLPIFDLVNLPQVLLMYRVHPQSVSWGSLKQVERQALRARVNALRHHQYPLWQSLFLVKPSLSFLVPQSIKKLIFHVS